MDRYVHCAGILPEGQSRVLQICVPDYGISEACELFFGHANHLRRREMRILRKVQKSLPNGCGYDRECPFPDERDRMYPVHGMRGAMFEKGIETLKKVENVLLPFDEEYDTLKTVR